MRVLQALPFISLASGLVITEKSIFQQFEKGRKSGQQLLDNTKDAFEDVLGKASDSVSQHADEAYHIIHKAGVDVEAWLQGSPFSFDGDDDSSDDPHHPLHHGEPDHPPHHDDPHHPHHPPNETIYQMISRSKYTTKLAELINEYEDLVDVLNSTKANYTVFAPTDAAFKKIPEHGHKPSKEFLRDVLLYHVSDDFYPARRVLGSYTIPTLYEPEQLGHKQRLTVRVTLRGPAINFYSHLVATDIFATNGVIHGVDSILVPPPHVATIIDLLPGEFSTLHLALDKTDLFEKINSTDYPHKGGILFAPSNFAFKKLGPRANAFLFSKYGLKYLKALLEYHMVVNQTLYSDAFFDHTGEEDDAAGRPPYYHYDLPTVLGKHVAIDVARYGPFVEIKINAFSRVTVHDGVASDGVIQVVSNVLIPPKQGAEAEKAEFWMGGEMRVEELKERLEPLVQEGEEDESLEL